MSRSGVGFSPIRIGAVFSKSWVNCIMLCALGLSLRVKIKRLKGISWMPWH